jgi:atypical dual specificity phosphatase
VRLFVPLFPPSAHSLSLSRHVLNVADDVPNFHEGKLIYKRLEVRDFGQDSGIARVFDQAFAFLAEREARKEPCLVHCAQGANRSATIAIAWVMKRSECKLEEAWAVVKAKRPGIVPLRDNRLALWELERKLHGCNFLSLDDVQRL